MRNLGPPDIEKSKGNNGHQRLDYTWYDKDGGEPLVFVVGYKDGGRFVLFDIEVREDAQRRGVGSAAVKWLKKHYEDILPVAVTPDAEGFWARLKSQGLIHHWIAVRDTPASMVVGNPPKGKTMLGDQIETSPGSGIIPSGSRMWYEYHCSESPNSQDAELWYRSHRKVLVKEVKNYEKELHNGTTRESRLDEAVPLVYRIVFDDGFEGTAFEDELLSSRKEFERPDPPKKRNPTNTILGDQIETISDAELFPDGLSSIGSNPGRIRFAVPLNESRRSKAHGYFTDGASGMFWYNELFKGFLKKFGEHTSVWISLLAATSPNNGVRTNVLYAFKAFCRWANGRDLYAHDPSIPEGNFRGFMGSHFANILNAVRGQPLNGPKVAAFDLAMRDEPASPRSVVVDRWVLRAMSLGNIHGQTLTVTLATGDTLRGKAVRTPEGFEMDLNEPVDYGMFTQQAANTPAARRLGVNFKQGATHVLVPFRAVKRRKDPRTGHTYPEYEWNERTLNEKQYGIVADAVTTLSGETEAMPREYQAAIWTGIKLEQDPTGIENYLSYFDQLFGPGLTPQQMLAYADAPRYVLSDAIGQGYFGFAMER